MAIFDIGSTLMDEEKAYLHRLHDVADAVNEPFEKIYEMAISLCIKCSYAIARKTFVNSPLSTIWVHRLMNDTDRMKSVSKDSQRMYELYTISRYVK